MRCSSLELVTLDAGGTVLRERDSRGAMYAEVARDEGISLTDAEMGELMRSVHDGLPRELGGSWRYELPWFAVLIEKLFVDELGLAEERLPGVREALFARYRDPTLFQVLPGAFELLGDLARWGVRVAIVSNWSPDLHALLGGLGLSAHVEFTLTSAEERCEKPDVEIFHRALERAGVAPENALHIGNDPRNDYDGALAAGMDVLLVGPVEDDGRHRAADLFAVSNTLSERLQ